MTSGQLVSVSGEQIAAFRDWARRYEWRQPELATLADRSEAEISEAINGARDWINGRRWSWTIVAANYLLDGRYHA